MSSNSGSIMAAAHIDASRFAAGPIDMKNIGEAEARKLMSAEHKALGYRPPPGSLVAEAQSVAAKRPQAGGAGLNLQLLEKAAADDAVRIKEQRGDVPVDRLGEGQCGLRAVLLRTGCVDDVAAAAVFSGGADAGVGGA